MSTKIIFSVEKRLKQAAIKKAKQISVSLSAVLNHATRAFVNDDLQIGTDDRAILNDIARARDDIERGFITSHDDLLKELRIQRN